MEGEERYKSLRHNLVVHDLDQADVTDVRQVSASTGGGCQHVQPTERAVSHGPH